MSTEMLDALVYRFVPAAIVLVALCLGVWLGGRLTLKAIARRDHPLAVSLLRQLRRPIFWILLLVLFRMALTVLMLPRVWEKLIMQFLAIALIGAVVYLLVRLTQLLGDYLLCRYDVSVADNLRARKMHTQFRLLKRIVLVVICFVGFAAILMTFEGVRQLGAGLLASAGLIGIIIGFAAQKTLHTLLTGIQIAITQPIRLDDVVIVEGEWGRIEEITLTYVVVRIWDQRRLIVPITYFIESPFQNWTRVSADILGSVFVYVDYTVPLEPLREHLRSILEQSELWDKRVCVLQVTNATERTVELRALVSASDAAKAWDLRCQVREQLVNYIRRQFPECLPRFRAELEPLKSVCQ